MTKTTWTKDDFIIKENEKVCGFTPKGRMKILQTQTLVIPYGITSIGKKAFESASIKKLVLPSSLTAIDEAAFLDCKIREIEGGENVEVLDEESFSCNIISDISNFKNLRVISKDAFKGNKITNFKAPKTLKFIGTSAFCYNGILICDLRDTENLEISKYAFKDNGVEELYLGKNARIEASAFYLNNIQTITGIETSKIEKDAFEEAIRKTYKKDFEVLPDKKWSKDDFLIEGNKLLCLSDKGEMKLNIFKHITIPHIEGVDTIDRDAFRKLFVKTVYISDGYKTIGEYSFYSSYIEYIRFPEDLKEIEKYAFEYSELKYVKIPKSVKSIGEYAFYKTNLIKADLSESKIKVLKDYIFSSCFYLREVLLPETLKTINTDAFSWGQSLKSIEIPENVLAIGENAFYKSGIRTIHFKNNQTFITIGERAFRHSKLTKIIGDDLMFSHIGISAFENTFLEEFKAKYVGKIEHDSFILLPISLVEIEEVSTISKEAFSNNGIKKVKLDKVREIQEKAFCNNLIEDLIFFDESVIKKIANQAFSCNNLKKVNLGEHVKKVSQFAFSGNPLEEFEMSEETKIEMLEI